MLVSQGATPRTTTPEEFKQIIAEDTQRFAVLIKQKGIHVN